ncbi:hypothetical protein SCLCIDRAFT_1112624 [Scleroderma citrinum Foug A]|uniref:Uncharacterized protein n=1 Tax=Scleroderma citrinum Foug A TaxID=1036808 RepID=A0A0C3A1W0_9AGAM|nr:hypothetical protein SCLCIDRAFT_1112624 [Scleroderma citrinum Foug A]
MFSLHCKLFKCTFSCKQGSALSEKRRYAQVIGCIMPIGAFMSLPGSNPSHIWPYLQSVIELGHSAGHRLRSKHSGSSMHVS